MNIAYLGNFKDPGFEGLKTIVRTLAKGRNVVMGSVKGCDIVHIHSNGFAPAIWYRNLRKFKIYSLHTNISCSRYSLIKEQWDFYTRIYSIKNDRISFTNRLCRLFMRNLSMMTPLFVKRYFLSKMDVVVVPNKLTAKQLRLKNVRVIHHGIDVKKFKPKAKKGKLHVGFFGHPSVGKGVLDVIEVFKKLDCKKSMYFTHTAWNIRGFVEKRAPEVKVHGFIKDIVGAYNEIDILVLPYIHTLGAIATPLTLIEAMACECAVITTDLPHLREICGDSVLYVRPGDVDGMVKAVNYLEDPHLRKALGKRARKRIVEGYSMEAMVKAYDKLYKEVA